MSLNWLSPTSLSIVLGTPTATISRPALGGELRHLVRGVHRVVAADVEEVTNLVRGENVQNAIEVFGLLRPQLIATRADRPGGRRIAQQRHLVGRLIGKIQQLLFEHPFDAVPRAIHGANLSQLARLLDDAAQ